MIQLPYSPINIYAPQHTHTQIYESLYGYEAPILQLSLARDDPRAMRFAMLTNDPSLDGPGRCLTSNDVENQYTACKFAAINTSVTEDGMMCVRVCVCVCVCVCVRACPLIIE
jgi:hypothetical protein